MVLSLGSLYEICVPCHSSQIKVKRTWYSSSQSWILLSLALLFLIFKILERQQANNIVYKQYRSPKLSYQRKVHNREHSNETIVPYLRDGEHLNKTFVPDRKDREAIFKCTELRIQEALKEDKGTGCEIPYLDPFSKDIMKYVKKPPKIDCGGKDWVECYLSKCRVTNEILDNIKNVRCTYRDIIHINDNQHRLGEPIVVEGDKEYTLTVNDDVKVSCQGIDDWSFKKKWSGLKCGLAPLSSPIIPTGREKSIDVLILGFDSISKNAFIRVMPKSYRFLVEELNATILDGYNVAGDGTRENLYPILTGKTECESPEIRFGYKNASYGDVKNLIFYKLKMDGYRTAYFEDIACTFQKKRYGFRTRMADHDLRSFFVESQKRINHNYCVGDTPRYKSVLNLTDQFFQMDGKHFCFTFISEISHDNNNVLAVADDDVAELLRSFKVQGRLNNTLLLVFADHGQRFSRIRKLFQAKLEERLPLMAVVLPEQLKRARPDAARALRHNAQVLTTPHDVYATVLDAIGLPQYYNPYKVLGADLKRGLSFIEPIPRNRSCSEAGIESHWCSCLKWDNVSCSDPLYKQSGEALIEYINLITKSVRSKCAARTLTSVDWVMRQINNKDLLMFRNDRKKNEAILYHHQFDSKKLMNHGKVNLMIKITTGPGTAIFEASMTYVPINDSFLITDRDISRTSAYGNEPNCIIATHPDLTKFCYCNEFLVRSQR